MDEEASGQTTVNIDLSIVNDKLSEITNLLSTDNKAIIRDCALTLYTNTNFYNNEDSPIKIAKDCVARALIIAKELQSQGLLD